MRIVSQRKFAWAVLFTGIFACSPVFADKPEGVGGGKPGKDAKEWQKGNSRSGHGRKDDRRDDRRDQQKRDDRADDRGDGRGDDRADGRGKYFDDHHRTVARDYFDQSFRSGHCPPGLAKKNNGCLPPGQAKKWSLGQPLPRDVIFYDLPRGIMERLGSPPAGHRFVRVDNDILLITVGTGMVIDAIQGLSQ
jgi:Domain of unknown function (DUF3315).